MEETPQPLIPPKETSEEQQTGTEGQPVVESQPTNETETLPQPESKGISNFFSNLGTRLGRFLRRLARGLAIFIVIFAIGFFTSYWLFYRPEHASFLNAQQQITDLQQELQNTKSELTKVSADLKALQERYNTTKTEAENLAVQVKIDSVIQGMLEAQYALSNGEAGVARQELSLAKETLQNIQPAISAQNPTLADDLLTRLQLVISEADRDPKTAQKDISILVDALAKVNELFE